MLAEASDYPLGSSGPEWAVPIGIQDAAEKPCKPGEEGVHSYLRAGPEGSR